MRKAIELIKNRKGDFNDEEVRAIRQVERARSISEAEASLKAGDVLGDDSEKEKFKDVIG